MNKTVVAIVIVLAILSAWVFANVKAVLDANPEGQEIAVVNPTCEDDIKEQSFTLSEVYSGENAEVNFKKLSSEYKEIINASLEKNVNFAGRYNIAEWGCGVGCQSHSMVDVTTGEIVEFDLKSDLGMFFLPNSSLLIINPVENTPQPVDDQVRPYLNGIERNYYEMKDGELNLICSEVASTGF